MKVGDKVIKNPETWVADERDKLGFRGIGVGIIVEPPFQLEGTTVDVRWIGGRYFELIEQLIKIEKDENN